MISNRRGVTRAAGLAVVAMLAVVGWAALKPIFVAAADAKPAAAAGQDRDMEIQVVDAVSKEPIAGAALMIYMGGRASKKDVTEQKGRAWVMLPEKDLTYLRIGVKKDGYVGKTVEYRESNAIPMSHTLELVRGTSIGGVINDEQGKPIAGVEVTCLVPGDGSAGGEGVRFYETVITRSDDQGQWRCDGIHPDLKSVSIKLAHIDFISDLANGYTSKPPMEQLRAMKGVIVMKRGLVINGVVLDEAGKPIENAVVGGGEERFGNEDRIRTDGEGRFVFRNFRPGTAVLTASARGHAPEIKQIKAVEQMLAIEFRLARGNTIRGKIVDKDGKPIGGATVSLEEWKGGRSLQWNSNSKADGTFVWAEAPSDEMTFYVSKGGYMTVRRLRMSPADKEYLITLRPPQKFHGSVVDAQTGKAVESFLVVPGRGEENMPMSWDRSDYYTKQGRDGKYEIEFTEPVPDWGTGARVGRVMSIEAPGYLPAVSPLYKMDQSDVVFDAKLTRGAGPAGTVLAADGKPAEGVEVLMAKPSSALLIRNGEFATNGGGKPATIKTGADGKFQLAPEIDGFAILAIGDGGYAEMTPEQLKASGEMKLQAWGKVVGKLKRGSKPWADQTMILKYNWRPDTKSREVWIEYTAKSDQDGNFTFERVVPKETRVTRQIPLNNDGRYSSYGYSPPEIIDVKPGQTVSVQLGGKGRPVIGKVIIPPEAQSQGWSLSGGISTKQLRLVLPEGFDEWTAQQMQEWRTKEGEKLRKVSEDSRKYYHLKIEEDGSFRVEDALAGDYQVQVMARDPNSQTGRALAVAKVDLTIPEIPGGQSDEPLDAGTLEFDSTRQVQVGGSLSKVTFKTIEGAPLKLADYNGKIVLIHVWSSRNTILPTELPMLKEVYEEFGKNGRLVMIGICTNSRLPTGKAFAEANGMKWMQAYVGINAGVYEDLGYPEQPAHLLIGPDGKLINNVTRIEDLKAEVSKAVGKAAK